MFICIICVYVNECVHIRVGVCTKAMLVCGSYRKTHVYVWGMVFPAVKHCDWCCRVDGTRFFLWILHLCLSYFVVGMLGIQSQLLPGFYKGPKYPKAQDQGSARNVFHLSSHLHSLNITHFLCYIIPLFSWRSIKISCSIALQ